MIFAFIVFEGKQIHMRMSHLKRVKEKESLLIESNIDQEYSDATKLTYPNNYIHSIYQIPHVKKYADWAGSIGFMSQDVPFNRFILYTFYYLVFLAMILWKILDPSINHLPINGVDDTNWKLVHCILALYLKSFILEELTCLMVHKQIIKAFKSFWRLFDMVTHVILTISIICHWTLYFKYNQHPCVTNSINVTETLSSESRSKTMTELELFYEIEDNLNQICVITFAIGKIWRNFEFNFSYANI